MAFLIIIFILIVAHELGHFIAAKRAGVWVEEFGLGLPPRVIGKKIGETIYSLNLFPFGGFVKLHGEQGTENIIKPKRAFVNQGKKTKLRIVIAGVIMNFLLAVFSFAIVYTKIGIPKLSEKVVIINVSEDSPAASADLKKEDVVKKVGNTEVKSVEQFISEVDRLKGTQAVLLIERPGEDNLIEKSLVPRITPPEGQGPLGVAITSPIEKHFPPVWQRPFIGVYYGFREALFWGFAVVSGLFMILKGILTGTLPEGLGGPVTLYALSEQAKGMIEYLNLLGVVSVNLAIINILPIPAVDGGRLVFILLEKLIGKRIKPNIEAAIHMAGIVALITFLILVSVKEIRLIRELGVDGYIEYLSKLQPQ